VILTFSTWAIFTRVLHLCGGRRALAALAMTLALALLLVVPLLLVAVKLGENVNHLADALRGALDTGLPPPPAWLARLPGVGHYLQNYWESLRIDPAAHGSEALAWLQAQAKPITTWLLKRGLDIGQAVLQLTLSVFAAFYLYRDGVAVAARFSAGMERIAGRRAQALIDLAARTVKGVVYGILGTSLAQGLAAGIGFSLAGVPGPLFLGLLTSVLSLVPVGPPLVWVPATLWLVREGSPGWATFMALWGFFVISGIDNLVKPWLISQGAALPFLIVLLGVIGGVLAFGFIGVFLGPTLLAVGFAVLREWTRGGVSPQSPPEAAGEGAEPASRGG